MVNIRALDTSSKQVFYSYTSGRLIFNEDLRLRELYVKSSPNVVLLQKAEKHLGPNHGHAACIAKFAEGRETSTESSF